MQWSLRFSSLTLFSDWYSSNHVLRGSGIRSGEVEMRIVEDSNTKANTISIIATDAAVPQPRNQKRRRKSNLLPSTVTLFANPRVVIALWGCFGQVSPLCGCDAVVPIFVKRTFTWNSFGAGLTSLVALVPSFISPGIGYLSDKYGPKWQSVFGYLACAPPLILLRLVGP